MSALKGFCAVLMVLSPFALYEDFSSHGFEVTGEVLNVRITMIIIAIISTIGYFSIGKKSNSAQQWLIVNKTIREAWYKVIKHKFVFSVKKDCINYNLSRAISQTLLNCFDLTIASQWSKDKNF